MRVAESPRVMTTVAERKVRREERLLKEAKREVYLMALWTGLKYIGATVGAIAAAAWLAVVMWDHPEWALTISWGLASLAIGAVLFKKAAERR